ncbi:C6 zinc finger domain-containing protein [Neofusicoccum parvum]|nr:C6 zinc finger domain-containing protein [Neofusicoccum parvum]
MSDEPQSKRPATRRSHKKTRTGCMQCKQRRVKCDEQKPTCGNCIKRGQPCSLQFTVPQLPYSRPTPQSSILPTASDNSSRTQSPVPLAPNLLPANASPYPQHASPGSVSTAPSVATSFSVEDMELLHHYTVATSLTFSTRSDVLEVYRIAAPEIAFSDPPLMHGLLAVSGLHRAHCCADIEKRRQYSTTAAAHQNIALGVFRERLSNLTRENCPGAFLFSAWLTLYVLGSMHQLQSSDPNAASVIDFEDPAEWIRLMRGVPSILRVSAVWEWVSESALRPILEPGRVTDEPLSPEMEARFATLRRVLVDAPLPISSPPDAPQMDDEERRIYAEALAVLQKYTAFILRPSTPEGPLDLVGTTMIWPNIVPDRWVEYLGAHRPGALVLLAQFAVLVNNLRGFWWAKGWGQGLVQIAWKLLPPEWKGLVEEPAKQVGCVLAPS